MLSHSISRTRQVARRRFRGHYSARTIAQLMTTARDHLSKADTVTIAAIETGVPALVQARTLIDRFHTMIRQKAEAGIDPWIAEAISGPISSFANGVTKDKAAVRAAITEPWSNGRVEGRITKLKLVSTTLADLLATGHFGDSRIGYWMIHGWPAYGGLAMTGMTSDWNSDLQAWLAPFLERLGHKARRRMCPLYVAGLIGPGDRKSIQPMAERLAPGDYDQLHHFIAGGVWNAAPLETKLLVQADRLVGGSDAVLVIDDTALPKKGDRSAGVAAQYASALGKTANCQTLVSLTLARAEVPVMVGLRLFLPDSWTDDPARLKRAGVPAAHRAARSKPEIALAEIDRAIAAGVRFGCVLADAGYGLSAPFRQGLTARGLTWAVGIPGRQKVYPADVKLIFPVAGRGRPRQRHIPDILSRPAEEMLAPAIWRSISWRRGTKGALKARFGAIRVRVADGPPQRIGDKGQQHLPGEEVWLIGERRTTGETKYYLANLPLETELRRLAAIVKARWICEQAHQQLKEELGLDHFEGRSWQGLHRHALMTMIAYAFLQHRRLASVGREKKNPRPAASAKPARRPSRHHQSHAESHTRTMSVLLPMAGQPTP